MSSSPRQSSVCPFCAIVATFAFPRCPSLCVCVSSHYRMQCHSHSATYHQVSMWVGSTLSHVHLSCKCVGRLCSTCRYDCKIVQGSGIQAASNCSKHTASTEGNVKCASTVTNAAPSSATAGELLHQTLTVE